MGISVSVFVLVIEFSSNVSLVRLLSFLVVK